MGFLLHADVFSISPSVKGKCILLYFSSNGVSCTQEQTSLFVRYMKIIGKLIHVCFNKLRLAALIVRVHLLLEIQVNVNS